MSNEQDKKPADTPASIPPLSELEKERRRAIGIQARAAIENVLTKGGSVSATQLAKWGCDGTQYFFQELRQRIQNEMLAPKPAAAAPSKTAQKRGGSGKTKPDTQPTEANEKLVATLPVTTERNWADQQRNRPPLRARAVLHGLIVAAVLFVGAAMSMQLLDALASFILQQIQNWI